MRRRRTEEYLNWSEGYYNMIAHTDKDINWYVNATHDIEDSLLIKIISKAEDWEPEQVYEMAKDETNMQKFYKYHEWIISGKELPIPIRLELVRAFSIHDKSGNIDKIIKKHSTGLLSHLLPKTWWGWLLLVWFILVIVF